MITINYVQKFFLEQVAESPGRSCQCKTIMFFEPVGILKSVDDIRTRKCNKNTLYAQKQRGNGEKMKKKAAIIFAVTLTTALVPESGRMGQANAAADTSAIISHTVIVGDSSGTATADWNEMLERLDAAIQEGYGRNVDYIAGDSVLVPTDIINHLAGKNATLALHMGNGIAFSVSGREIHKVDYPVQITLCEESDIPDEVMQHALEGIAISKEFCMREKEPYPCPINVHLSFGAQNAGRNAVLYYYDEFDGTLKQQGIFRIQESGNAMFGLGRGDEYIVAVMKGYTVEEGDALSRIAVRNGISLKALAAANPQITDIDNIRVGQRINIPAQ